MAQAVGNLVDNAVKYLPPSGKISLSVVSCRDGQIEIVVADNGAGIADAEKPRVTQRFYRCEASFATAGIGLGLSLVEAVARLHDGSLTLADNHPGLKASLKLPEAPGIPRSNTGTSVARGDRFPAAAEASSAFLYES